jgi:hypothetical protein
MVSIHNSPLRKAYNDVLDIIVPILKASKVDEYQINSNTWFEILRENSGNLIVYFYSDDIFVTLIQKPRTVSINSKEYITDGYCSGHDKKGFYKYSYISTYSNMKYIHMLFEALVNLFELDLTQ